MGLRSHVSSCSTASIITENENVYSNKHRAMFQKSRPGIIDIFASMNQLSKHFKYPTCYQAKQHLLLCLLVPLCLSHKIKPNKLKTQIIVMLSRQFDIDNKIFCDSPIISTKCRLIPINNQAAFLEEAGLMFSHLLCSEL